MGYHLTKEKFDKFFGYLKKSKDERHKKLYVYIFNVVQEEIKVKLNEKRINKYKFIRNDKEYNVYYFLINKNNRKNKKIIYAGLIKKENTATYFYLDEKKYLTKDEFIRKIMKKSISSNLDIKTFNQIKFYFNTINIEKTNTSGYYLKDEDEYKKLSYALKNFKMYYLKPLFSLKREFQILERITNKNIDFDLLKELRKFGLNNKDNYFKLKNKKNLNIKNFLSLVNEYPLFINLFLLDKEKMVEREQAVYVKLERQLNKLNEKEDWINEIKMFFNLTNENMQFLKNLNWQKATAFKNRPVLLFEILQLINLGEINLNINDLKTREDFDNLYVFYYYIYSNNRIIINKKEKLDLKMDWKKSNKQIITNYIREIRSQIINNYEGDYYNYKININDFIRFNLEAHMFFFINRSINYKDKNLSFFNNEITIDNKNFSVSSNNLIDYDFISEEESFKVEIRKIKNDSLEYKINGLNKEKEMVLRDLIDSDYKHLFNKRYQKLNVLKRANIYAYFENVLNNKNIEEVKKYFYILGIYKKKDYETSEPKKINELYNLNLLKYIKNQNVYVCLEDMI